MAIAAVMALQPLFVGALVITRQHADLPAIREHITAAFANGILSADETPQQLIHRGGHQFTECTGLLVSIDPQPDPLMAALRPVMHSPYVGPCGEVEHLAQGIETADRTHYARYWHGYRVYLWPMLSIFSLSTVRYINALMLLVAAVSCFLALRGAIGTTSAATYFVVLLSLTDIWRMWNITTHALSTILIFAATTLFTRLYRRSHNLMSAIVMAAIFGAVFNFVDFLINPPWMPMMLAFIVLACDLKRPTPLARAETGAALLPAFFVALAWFGGYGLTWVSEWILAIWISPDGRQAGNEIIRQIVLRLYGVETDSMMRMYPLVPTLKMIVQAFISAGSIVVAALAAAMAIFLRRHWRLFDGRRFLLLCSPTLVAVAWFEILNNHTQTHSHFTYRSESAAIAVIFAAVFMATDAPVSLPSLCTDLWSVLSRRPEQPSAA